MSDRRSQDAVERALSDLIVAVACDDDADDIEVKNIADVLKLYRKHRTGKPRQPRRRNVRVTPLPTLDELVGEVNKPAAEQPPAPSLRDILGEALAKAAAEQPPPRTYDSPLAMKSPPADPFAIPPNLDKRGKK